MGFYSLKLYHNSSSVSFSPLTLYKIPTVNNIWFLYGDLSENHVLINQLTPPPKKRLGTKSTIIATISKAFVERNLIG